jgi:uncharacterized membrane protein YqaE (UPF0057 family)
MEIQGLIGVIVLAVLYFIPGLIAGFRGHPNATPVLILNLFLGWTVLGWIVALIWSFTAIEE